MRSALLRRAVPHPRAPLRPYRRPFLAAPRTDTKGQPPGNGRLPFQYSHRTIFLCHCEPPTAAWQSVPIDEGRFLANHLNPKSCHCPLTGQSVPIDEGHFLANHLNPKSCHCPLTGQSVPIDAGHILVIRCKSQPFHGQIATVAYATSQ